MRCNCACTLNEEDVITSMCGAHEEAFRRRSKSLQEELISEVTKKINRQETIDNLLIELGDTKLVAGRYQTMWQNAQLALNKIEDYFEYAYEGEDSLEAIKRTVMFNIDAYVKNIEFINNLKGKTKKGE